MDDKTPYSLKKLRSEFESRVKKNPRYSLRAFARFLDIEAPSLSAILRGKRQIPRHKIKSVIDKLGLSPKEAHFFEQAPASATSENQEDHQDIHELDFILDNEMHFNIISEWEHGALLSLMETASFNSDTRWMADRLGIPESRVTICLSNLVSAKMVSLKGDQYRTNQKNAGTSKDIPSRAIKRAHRENLQLGDAAIDDVEVSLRDLSSVTLTLNEADLPELKQSIRRFRKRFMKQAEAVPGDEVYKLSIQLIPLTKKTIKRSKS